MPLRYGNYSVRDRIEPLAKLCWCLVLVSSSDCAYLGRLGRGHTGEQLFERRDIDARGLALGDVRSDQFDRLVADLGEVRLDVDLERQRHDAAGESYAEQQDPRAR